MPISDQHPGLLRVFHINRNDREGYFYYVMELADAHDPDWIQNGTAYKPLDLKNVCDLSEGQRLAIRDCVVIGLALADALNFLHERGLVHRDIKPSNIIFVNGCPKLADVGLVRVSSPDASLVGTLIYMPPPPEPPGTPQADIYALGMVLYVISTGKHPRSFSELSTTLVEKPEFMRVNEIICKACHPELSQRYAKAAEMHDALQEVHKSLFEK